MIGVTKNHTQAHTKHQISQGAQELGLRLRGGVRLGAIMFSSSIPDLSMSTRST